jgi:AraC-like DNA-binding protein
MHLISEIEEDIIGLLVDTTFKEEVLLKHTNNTDASFVALCFYLFDFDVNLIFEGSAIQFGKLDYNFMMLDGALNLDHQIDEKQMQSYIIYIIIKKTALREYMNKIYGFTDNIFFDTEKNMIINLDRIPHESLVFIDNFRKISPDTPFYELKFKALVYRLLENYLEQLKTKKIIIGKVVSEDVKRIIASQRFLQKNNEDIFPGIDSLANEALMSVANYKKKFTKILGLSPAAYFYNSKLEKAKQLLETKQYTVGEIAEKLNYSSASYLSKGFSKRYGVSPKEYQNLL